MTDVLGSVIQGFLTGIGSGFGIWFLGRHVTKKLEKIEDQIINGGKK